jgi:TPP-dependent indolepyruvate ferredoxin oxidoreductase alpha subunit
VSALARLIAARMLGKSKKRAPVKSTLTPRAVKAALVERLGEREADDYLRRAVEALKPAAPAAPPPPPKIEPGWRGSCKAIDADTGRRCRLPAHAGEAHRHERGPFFRTAPPEQTHFRAREQLDAAATSRNHTNNEAP